MGKNGYSENHNGKNKRMKNITINYPILYDTMLLKLIEEGIIPSKSEAIRRAIGEYLRHEIKDVQFMTEYTEDFVCKKRRYEKVY